MTELLKLGCLFFYLNDNSVIGLARNILSQEQKNKIKHLGQLILGCAEMMKDPVYQLWQLRGISCSRPSGQAIELSVCH